jgi:hypothetical protein
MASTASPRRTPQTAALGSSLAERRAAPGSRAAVRGSLDGHGWRTLGLGMGVVHGRFGVDAYRGRSTRGSPGALTCITTVAGDGRSRCRARGHVPSRHQGSTYVAKRVSPAATADLVAGCEVAAAVAEAGFVTGPPVPTSDGRLVLTEHALRCSSMCLAASSRVRPTRSSAGLPARWRASISQVARPMVQVRPSS